jgi:hypothetical protein
MADFGILIGWGNAVRGREQKSVAVFGEAVELLTRWQQEGQIEGWDVFFLEPHGGDLSGFFLVRGERDTIAKLRASDELADLNLRANLIVDGFGVVGFETGARVEEQMGKFVAAAGELA